MDIPDDYILVTDSQDRKAIEEHFGSPEWMDYGCYFVFINEGDILDVFGVESSIPYDVSWCDKIWFEED
jgi:hypothetical protein